MGYYDNMDKNQVMNNGAFTFTYHDAIEQYEYLITLGTHNKAQELLAKDFDYLTEEQREYFLDELSGTLETILERVYNDIEDQIDIIIDQMADKVEKKQAKE